MTVGDGIVDVGSASSPMSVGGRTETDMTCQAFAKWLTELKARSSRTLQDMLSEMSIIRDGITSSNMELTDFKRHSTGISQQMQGQLTDLREKLTHAFGEITTLVKQKTISDQEMMQDINSLQQNLSTKTSELEALKKSYTQAHTQLQSSLIQIQNNLTVTTTEVQASKASCDKVQRDATYRFTEIDSTLRGLEDELSVGNAENRSQMLQLQEEIARIHDSLSSVGAEFSEHKRATNTSHNKLQSMVWGLQEGGKQQPHAPEPQGQLEAMSATHRSGQYPTASPPQSSASLPHMMQHMQPAGYVQHSPSGPGFRPGSLNMPQAGAPPNMLAPSMATRASVAVPGHMPPFHR